MPEIFPVLRKESFGVRRDVRRHTRMSGFACSRSPRNISRKITFLLRRRTRNVLSVGVFQDVHELNFQRHSTRRPETVRQNASPEEGRQPDGGVLPRDGHGAGLHRRERHGERVA